MEPQEQISQLETTVKDLQKALSDERQKSAQLETDLNAAIEVNEELTAKLDENVLQPTAPAPQEKETVSGKTFKSDGGTYGFRRLRVSHKGKVITAAEILADKDLQKELVGINSGMIYKK